MKKNKKIVAAIGISALIGLTVVAAKKPIWNFEGRERIIPSIAMISGFMIGYSFWEK